jgi:hypothetical protein
MDGKQEPVDPNVAAVQHKLGARSKAAATKYGVDTTRTARRTDGRSGIHRSLAV